MVIRQDETDTMVNVIIDEPCGEACQGKCIT